MISISPFQGGSCQDASRTPLCGAGLQCSLKPQAWLDGGTDFRFVKSGRSAISACLEHLGLSAGDEVFIETTTGGSYVSSCVTGAIDPVCRWSREFSSKTKLILVIHEFGVPCPAEKLRYLASLGIPLLEDCAYGIGSRLMGAALGEQGDYALYSLSKHYPLAKGGLLLSKRKLWNSESPDWASFRRFEPSRGEIADFETMLCTDISTQVIWNSKRRERWDFFSAALADLGAEPYFELDRRTVPGAFVCKLPESMDGAALKKKFQNAGVEATEYYGHGGFYFPVHQNLTDSEADFLVGLMHSAGDRPARG